MCWRSLKFASFVVFGMAWLMTGCMIRHAEPSAGNDLREDFSDVGVRTFDGYEPAFNFMARREGLPTDRQTVFQFAADSTLKNWNFEPAGDLTVVEVRFCGSIVGYIPRGVQNQGNFYIFQRRGSKWKLVGIVEGGGYRWSEVNHGIQIITTWHYSADENPETTYTWNGILFERTPK